MEELPAADLKVEGYGDKETLAYLEVEREDWSSLLDFHNQLIYHLGSSPSFMKFPKINNDQLYHRTSETTRYFAVKDGEQLIAYIKVESEGENFITLNPGMLNICGAYCLPQYRGRGIYQKLLSYMISILKKEGYSLLGVDCESFNPTARGFWLKYFTEYTHSVVRRIDDKAIQIFN
ncbi:GNAT family N-acetyltransferase [Mobilitalea sibirica]|uniref:GNAT family N-acetyltransferase n=2 Tax=Mobilitalea sibirica TaxID=1462919 RepID=A0A8J7KVK8_9FIRM|nr:GNAT family N-acetyltransferase [Mobilitalea sibirica]